jgi:hypothetical protein
MNEKSPILEQEIAHIAERSQQFEKDGLSYEEAIHKSIEQYAKNQAQEFISDVHKIPEHEYERIVLKLKPDEHDRQVEELFQITLKKGIKNAFEVIYRMNNPHLEDDFHRFLVQYLHTIGAIPSVKKESYLSQALEHTLFAVTLPKEESEKDFKSFIGAMKQFYSSISSLSSYLALELAVQNSGKNITLYVAIPRADIQTVEKLIHAYYPHAVIEEQTDDYNIFSPTGGFIALSTAGLENEPIFPIKTDEDFSHDPFSAIIGALSGLEGVGEGACVQMIIKKDLEGYNKIFLEIIKSAEKGDGDVKKLYKEETRSLGSAIGKEIFSLFGGGSDKSSDEKKVDSLGISLLKKKNKSELFNVGIRIVSSAQSKERAESILSAIKTAFNQFTLVGSNSLLWKDEKTKTLLQAIHDFSFRIPQKDMLLLSVDEIGTLFHFPIGITTGHDLSEATYQTAPIPENMKDGIIIGENNFRGKKSPVTYGKEDRVRHTYVIGQTGTGKTVFLLNMVIQDIKAGNGVCFIDPHGSDIEKILANIPAERIDDVIYFDPAYTARPMGLNLLEFDERFPEQKIFVINELLAIFNKLFDMKIAGGPAFEQYFRNAAGLIMEDPASGSTLLEISRVMSDKTFRDMKLSKCRNPIINQFWENAEKTTGEGALANYVPYITNKFDPFISNDIMRPVIAQQKSALNFRDIMDNKKILLVNLSKGRLGDINSHLIGLLLVGKITMAALSRVDIVGKQEVNDFYLYIDEFQNVTTDSINTILSEARKYRLSLNVAHQFIEQLDDGIRNAVFGNVGTMVVHRVSAENAEVFAKTFEPTFSPKDIIKLDNLNCYIKMLVGGVPAKPFNSRTPYPPAGNPDIVEKIKELSYLKYGKDRAIVEEEIMARYRK